MIALVLTASLVAVEPVEVEGQPLAANIARLVQALEFLGSPLPAELAASLKTAGAARDAKRLQELLDPHVLAIVSLNPEVRVKAARGPAPATLQQGGFTPVIIKVINESTVTKPLRVGSPQAGPPYAGVALLSMTRQNQLHLRENENTRKSADRFLEVGLFSAAPMTAQLSGLKVEYALAAIWSGEAGKREATLAFDVGEGTQDLGFRAELPILFDIKPAITVKLAVRDVDGKPTTARLEFRDRAGRIHPPQAGRLAPDLFFQQQVYRRDGETVLLPPGELVMRFGRGPEYRTIERAVTIPATGVAQIEVRLQRWIDAAEFGFYSGDHHIHAAGCAHYTHPTEGVRAGDMFRQVQGEGLNVGCVLTWGPCYDFQRTFFSRAVDPVSEPLTLLKYDVEVSGFGSQALGHVCLLNLRDQTYPGSNGTAKNWPTWTTPVLKWAKAQGGVTGYAHSASGLQIDAAGSAKRLLTELDADKDGTLSRAEAAAGLPVEPFETTDANRDGVLSFVELTAAADRAADRLPNLAVPEMNGVGAQEVFVTAASGVCDFISAMDSARIPEWNCWYHILNCGLPLKVSGETDFPCMSGTRVGQGRVYVQLGRRDRLDFAEWCRGLAAGRSYVSDGYAHALRFDVEGKTSGERLELDVPRTVRITAKVAFGSQTPVEAAHGLTVPKGGLRMSGDTVNLHPGADAKSPTTRTVELIMNGRAVAQREVPADDKMHDLAFDVKVEASSWVALRQFPQMHTNAVEVIVAGKPIRASRSSALWCIACIEQLWRVRGKVIAAAERDEADRAFKQAIEYYRRAAAEAPAGS